MSTVALANSRMAIFDKTKGSIPNRIACSREHFKNELKTGVGMTLGTAAGAFLGHSIYQSGLKEITKPNYVQMLKNAKGLDKLKTGAMLVYSKAQDALVSLLQAPKIQQWVKKSDSVIGKITNGGLNKLGPAFKSKGAKTGLAVALAGAVLAVFTGAVNYSFKKGQIDQKYTDKAKNNSTQELTKAGRKYQTLAEKIATMSKTEVFDQEKADEYEAFMQAVVNARKY